MVNQWFFSIGPFQHIWCSFKLLFLERSQTGLQDTFFSGSIPVPYKHLGPFFSLYCFSKWFLYRCFIISIHYSNFGKLSKIAIFATVSSTICCAGSWILYFVWYLCLSYLYCCLTKSFKMPARIFWCKDLTSNIWWVEGDNLMKRWQHYRWLWSLDSLLVCVRMINDRKERKMRM